MLSHLDRQSSIAIGAPLSELTLLYSADWSRHHLEGLLDKIGHSSTEILILEFLSVLLSLYTGSLFSFHRGGKLHFTPSPQPLTVARGSWQGVYSNSNIMHIDWVGGRCMLIHAYWRWTWWQEDSLSQTLGYIDIIVSYNDMHTLYFQSLGSTHFWWYFIDLRNLCSYFHRSSISCHLTMFLLSVSQASSLSQMCFECCNRFHRVLMMGSGHSWSAVSVQIESKYKFRFGNLSTEWWEGLLQGNASRYGE